METKKIVVEIKHQKLVIKSMLPSLAIVILKEPVRCFHCQKKLEAGTSVKRQIRKESIRYYHMNCPLNEINKNYRP